MIIWEFKLLNNLKFLFVFIYTFIFTGCYIHYTKEILTNKILEEKDNNLGRTQLPIKLKLDRSNIPKSIALNIKRSSSSTRKDNAGITEERLNNYLENYYSEEILSKFKMSELFISNPDSNVLILIKPLPDRVEFEDVQGLFLYTFGFIPFERNSYGEITFEIIDLNKNEKIKAYTYEMEHSAYEGLSMFLLSPFIPLFSDYIDHSTNERTFSIMRRAFEAFFLEFQYDLVKDPKLLESFYVKDSPNYSVQFKKSLKENKYDSLLLSNMESALISKGFQIFELDELSTSKTKIDRIISIENLSYEKTGSGNKETIQINYEAICNDSLSKETFWKQNIKYTTKPNDVTDHEIFQNAVQELFNKLRDNGDI